jgi:hypothetical protein
MLSPLINFKNKCALIEQRLIFQNFGTFELCIKYFELKVFVMSLDKA